MTSITLNGKTYPTDAQEFLTDASAWDENFAEGLAPRLKIQGGLTPDHWRIIRFIRDTYKEIGKCPSIYQTCRMNKLRLADCKRLFPTGYLRGACKLAGLTYREGYLNVAGFDAFVDQIPSGGPERIGASQQPSARPESAAAEKIYGIDVRGFLVDPEQWDEQYAQFRAFEMKITENLTEQHWRVIRYLRSSFKRTGIVPTVYETCEANDLELDDLEKLFPDGYHRGAVKIAGLRVR